MRVFGTPCLPFPFELPDLDGSLAAEAKDMTSWQSKKTFQFALLLTKTLRFLWEEHNCLTRISFVQPQHLPLPALPASIQQSLFSMALGLHAVLWFVIVV